MIHKSTLYEYIDYSHARSLPVYQCCASNHCSRWYLYS